MLAKPTHLMEIRRCGYVWVSLLAASLLSSPGNAQTQNGANPRLGVTTPGVRRSMVDIHPDATFDVEGQPDWMVVTDDAVWEATSTVNHALRLDPAPPPPTPTLP